ncbi:DUF2496 domain-containing protein [Psychromonas sp. SR45-3]|uniref:DUF2496 domain-containing protein n=1 Tax=Psychromonas sp. SR45-3 TaxID=2760930 RepID=UPI0015FB4B0B|nr:DUF2496 domain-containing protein [Psychromonas sp. SR45-3]MBB1273783.1 DUF2496 domain-containing protein [Psychromonas sp. SR45-3]
MTNNDSTIDSGLVSAPLEIKLAVDLIQLLEDNNLPLEATIKALEITLRDFKNKQLTQLKAPKSKSLNAKTSL